MADLDPGLYEQLVTEGLRAQLRGLAADLQVTDHLLGGDAADRIAWHLSRQVERALRDVPEQSRVEVGIRVAGELLDHLGSSGIAVDPADRPVEPGSVLRAVLRRRPDGSPAPVSTPVIPVLDTTLLTNAPGEPTLWTQLLSEIESADEIDLVMAFIRRSGIRPLLPALRRHCQSGRPLRVLTTTFTGTTEPEALDLLAEAGAEVRVSYDTTATRLHAKAWVFRRRTGFTTVYVGSSNLTHTATNQGLEWNVRASAARNADVIEKVHAVYASYWESGDFIPYARSQFDELARRSSPVAAEVVLPPTELRPLPFQERLLELIQVARQRGLHRNLLAAATGTGKTVMAALDYASLRRRLSRSRLLFVAHRKEILEQCRATFRYALRDPGFGELWVGGARPTRFDHVFASIQSLHATDLDALAPDHFDVVIVDEFHHAAARSYDRLLAHVDPVELLGLTATPERSDGLPVLHWFGDRIAAELRLWEAIDQQYLSPFVYYGIHDGVDLRHVPWRRGQGYDVDALSDVYTSSDAWARLVVQAVAEHTDVDAMRALGFCVSVAHAQFMARHFTRHHIPAVAVSAGSSPQERVAALQDLAAGRVRVVFTVDLFNEGVDVPDVDTLLMLRPTESPTLFLQQLGRGIRKAPGKGACTVLDFVGIHRTEFRFDRRYRALLGGTRRDVERAVKQGFPFLPAGCYAQLDEKASEIVLRSLREAIPTRWPAKVEELRSIRQARGEVDLATFLAESGLDLDDVYDGPNGWSRLLQDAGAPVMPSGPAERALRRAVGRLLHVDDDERIAVWQRLLSRPEPPVAADLSPREQRLVHMLVASVGDQALTADMTVDAGARLLWRHPQVLADLRQLLTVLDERIDHVHVPLPSHPTVPLQVHARYTRLEILAAFAAPSSKARIAAWQTGVRELPHAKADVFAFTLDKSSGAFSPTTRYRDYAISPTLLHWESQSVTRADSSTGLRYRNHERMGHTILLFARLRADDRAFWFLGPGRYLAHTGERPMAITWELDHPLPGDLFQVFAAAVA